MMISRKTSKSKNNITSLQNIPFVDSYKYLGITLSKNLHTDIHLNGLQRRANLFKKSEAYLKRTHITLKVRLETWLTFMRNNILFGSEIMYLHNKDMKKLDQIYNHTLKYTCNLPNTTSSHKTLLFSRQWPLEFIVIRRILASIKLSQRLYPMNLSSPTFQRLSLFCRKHELDLNELVSSDANTIHKILHFAQKKFLINSITSSNLNSIPTTPFKSTIFAANDFRDDPLLRMLTGISLSLTKFSNGTKTFNQCPTCHKIGNQDHFINECPIFRSPRNSFLRDLRSLIMTTDQLRMLQGSIRKFILNYFTLECDLYDPKVKSFITNAIKTFIDCIHCNFHTVMNY